MRALVAILVTGLLTTTLTACGRSQSTKAHSHLAASWADGASTVAGLAKNSDAVALVAITAVVATGQDPDPFDRTPYTSFTATVRRWLMGTGDATIQIKQTGDTSQQVDDDPLLKVGEVAVVFLHEFAENKYYIVGGPTGRFHLDDQDHLVPLPGGVLHDRDSLSTLAAQLPPR